MKNGETPKVSTLSTLWYSESLAGDRTQVAYVQEIPPLKSAKEAITYNALDLDEEQQAKGSRKAETLTIPLLFTEKQHDTLKTLADSDKEYYWFIKLPESTAQTTDKPIVFNFTGACDLGLDTIAIDDLLKENLTIYRSSAVNETKGFPTSAEPGA
jgi:hypothetical protein